MVGNSAEALAAVETNPSRLIWLRKLPWPSLVVFLLFWGLYAATGCWKWTGYNAHVHLAWAMLHGQFNLIDPPGHFEMLRVGGKAYIAYGVGPTLMMLPLVAIWGPSFHQALFAAALAAWAVALWWSTLGLLQADPKARIALTACFGVGSLFWYYGGQNGNTWTIMHVVTVWGLMLAIRETLGKQRGWIVGVGFGLAVLSRQAVLLAAPFFLVLLFQDRNWRKLLGFAAGAGAFLGFGAFYNFARFGTPFDNAYKGVILATTPANQVPWGIFHPNYIAQNLQGYFLKLPARIPEFPYFDPTLDGFTILLSLPALLYLFRADYRQRINQLALLACLGILGLYLCYYWSGFAQFGRRYSVDFLPFAMLLIAMATKDRLRGGLVLATLAGIAVEAWGIGWWLAKGW